MSEPHEEHLLLGTDYSLLETILPKLSRRVCITASEPPLPVKTAPPGESVRMQHESLYNKLRFPLKAVLILTAVCIFILMNCRLKSIIKMINSFLLFHFTLSKMELSC